MFLILWISSSQHTTSPPIAGVDPLALYTFSLHCKPSPHTPGATLLILHTLSPRTTDVTFLIMQTFSSLSPCNTDNTPSFCAAQPPRTADVTLLVLHTFCPRTVDVALLYFRLVLMPHTLSSCCICSPSDILHSLLTQQKFLFTLHNFLVLLHTFSPRTAIVTFLVFQTFSSNHTPCLPTADVAFLIL